MNIFICAGDASGDIHAANLAKVFKRTRNDIVITSLGGERLKEVSDRFLFNLVELGGFGFWQPLMLFFKLRGVLIDIVINYFIKTNPDKVIIVDYYGFNIHVAKAAFERNIPVYYYISPQVWATRPKRVFQIAKYVKKILVTLPFEEKLYRDAGIDAVFVGNPLIDMVPKPKMKIGTNVCIGLFPGSRPNVIKRHIQLLIEAAELINKEIPAEFKIFCASALNDKKYGDIPYSVVVEDDYTQRETLTFALTTSGTVSLENALLGIPMVVYYKLSKFNYFIAKMLANIRYITMVNILLDKMLVPELIQNDATPEKISKAVIETIKDDEKIESMKNAFWDIRNKLGSPNVSARAAGIILNDNDNATDAVDDNGSSPLDGLTR
jgi:lipid-A-disaccharide synthase